MEMPKDTSDKTKVSIWELVVKDQLITFSGDFANLLRMNITSPLSLAEFIQQLQPLIKRQENQTLVNEIQQRLKEERELVLENKRIVFPDGNVTYIGCSSTTLYNMDGKPERMTGMLWMEGKPSTEDKSSTKDT